MAKRRAQIRLLAILVAALVVGPVGAETLVVSAARMLDVTNGSELHALKMATIYAADLLGVDDRGVIAVGKRADLVVVPGNPLNDIRVMEDVRFVMKQGRVYRQE